MSQATACLILWALDCTFALKQSRLISDATFDVCDGVCALLITKLDLVAQPQIMHCKSRETYQET